MKVVRTVVNEFKSEEAFEKILASYAVAVPTILKLCETTTVVKTSPTSCMALSIFPNNEAADSTIEARSKWFKSHEAGIKDHFMYDGDVALYMTGKGENLLTTQPDEDSNKQTMTLKKLEHIEAKKYNNKRLRKLLLKQKKELAELKSMLAQVLAKLPS